ncbi:MAG: dihydropteroate synthase [Phycisphaerae bacterium]
MVSILGILNLTRDSFSDGGRFVDPRAAIEHAGRLVADGAAIVDVGAESTHPDAEDVSAADEIRRLDPVIGALVADGFAVSVDTCKPAVMRAAIAQGVVMINDVNGFRDPDAIAAVRDADVRLIVMHNRSPRGRARPDSGGADATRAAPPTDGPPALGTATIVDEIAAFFQRQVAALTAAGVRRERIILDPGMGLFLGRDPALSVRVLRELARLGALGLPLCVSVSRKSFIGATLAAPGAPARPVDQRGAGTLAAELWAAANGAELIRTHDVRALRDAITMWSALRGDPAANPSGGGAIAIPCDGAA